MKRLILRTYSTVEDDSCGVDYVTIPATQAFAERLEQLERLFLRIRSSEIDLTTMEFEDCKSLDWYATEALADLDDGGFNGCELQVVTSRFERARHTPISMQWQGLRLDWAEGFRAVLFFFTGIPRDNCLGSFLIETVGHSRKDLAEHIAKAIATEQAKTIAKKRPRRSNAR